MQIKHIPLVNARYWTAITLASVFGTNLGDLYAHESGFGLIGGLPILIAAFFAIFVAERFDRAMHDTYYWLCILILRTGATNIADSTYTLLDPLPTDDAKAMVVLGFIVGWALLIGLFAWACVKIAKPRLSGLQKAVPETNGFYWSAMLSAAIFGTLLGDMSWFALGSNVSALALSGILAAALLSVRFFKSISAAHYWIVVAIIRTAGTAIGDWMADEKTLGIGLAVSTLVSGLAFFGVVALWRMGGAAKTAHIPA